MVTGLLLCQAVELYAQELTKSDSLLNSLEVKFHPPSKFRISNPIRKFRYQKVNRKLVNAISEDLIIQLKQKGYYIAKLDSFQFYPEPSLSSGKLQLHFSMGPLFILHNVKWNMPDSIQGRYDEYVQSIAFDYYEKPYTESSQNQMFARILVLFENSGYPLCKITTEAFSLDSLSLNELGFNLIIHIDPGKLIKISGLKLPEDSDIDNSYLEKSFRFHKNELYQENRIERYERILRKQDFVKTTEKPVLVQDEKGHYFLRLNFEKTPVTTLDGVVGYVPPPANDPTESGYFTGLFNIGLKNLFGTGRRLDVYWQKPDRFSEEFRVKYREPYMLGLPFHVGAMLHRLVRDTTYIEWEYSLNAEVPINENLSGFIRLFNREVFPDSLASAQLRLPQTRAIHSEIGLKWDSRSDLYNPRKGILFSAYFDYGTQRNVGPQYLLIEDSLADRTNVRKVSGEIALFLEGFKNQVLALHLHSILIGYQGTQVRPPDMFWFGGATTVRGYRENQFFGDKVGWLNAEYRFLVGPRTRLFVFTDLAYYSRNLPEKKEEYLVGYGAGLSFPGPIGILQVDYGLARNLSFREGKIHFRIINEF
jgi:outer membrane protein insertion porin family